MMVRGMTRVGMVRTARMASLQRNIGGLAPALVLATTLAACEKPECVCKFEPAPTVTAAASTTAAAKAPASITPGLFAPFSTGLEDVKAIAGSPVELNSFDTIFAFPINNPAFPKICTFSIKQGTTEVAKIGLEIEQIEIADDDKSFSIKNPGYDVKTFRFKPLEKPVIANAGDYSLFLNCTPYTIDIGTFTVAEGGQPAAKKPAALVSPPATKSPQAKDPDVDINF